MCTIFGNYCTLRQYMMHLISGKRYIIDQMKLACGPCWYIIAASWFMHKCEALKVCWNRWWSVCVICRCHTESTTAKAAAFCANPVCAEIIWRKRNWWLSSKSIANALGLLQSCAKPSKWRFVPYPIQVQLHMWHWDNNRQYTNQGLIFLSLSL